MLTKACKGDNQNKMRLLTNEQQELHENAKICYTYKRKFQNKYAKDIKYL